MLVRLSVLPAGRLYPQATFLVLISVRSFVDPKATVRPEFKKCNDTIGNRTRDLSGFSAVPQPTAPPRAAARPRTVLIIVTYVALEWKQIANLARSVRVYDRSVISC